MPMVCLRQQVTNELRYSENWHGCDCLETELQNCKLVHHNPDFRLTIQRTSLDSVSYKYTFTETIRPAICTQRLIFNFSFGVATQNISVSFLRSTNNNFEASSNSEKRTDLSTIFSVSLWYQSFVYARAAYKHTDQSELQTRWKEPF